MTAPRVLAIVGPTASGKSALAVAVAARLGDAEVVGTDSMQAYRGMDLGTATPTEAERAGVPHHMIDVWDPREAVSVAEFQSAARAAIDGIRARGATPVVVGGSGLYVAAVLDDLRFPGTDPVVRARLEADLARMGPAALHARLAEVDPAAAQEILASNGRRIVRALEVIEITGGPFVARLPPAVDIYPCVRVGLSVPRPVLDERIARRVERMWADGLMDEVAGLPGLDGTPTASRALGYREAAEALAGRMSPEQARRETVDATRRFARRQERWFRRDARITWLPFDAPGLVDDVLGLYRGTAT